MGGHARPYTKDELDEMARTRQKWLEEKNQARRKFAQKIVTVVVDKINHDIIRPGPKPEERECYDVAHEIRDMSPMLIDLVSDVIKVKEEEG